MALIDELMQRANNACELCSSSETLNAYEVAPSDGSSEQAILVCATCKAGLEETQDIDENHWRCLNDSMWSTTPAVQVAAYRMLHKLAHLGWPQDLLDMLFLEDDVKAWAEAGMTQTSTEQEATRDSNGTVLHAGDSVTIIKDLEVKGAGFTAKRGTVVKNIALTDNPEQIEGRVNGTRIVLLSKFLKKA